MHFNVLLAVKNFRKMSSQSEKNIRFDCWTMRFMKENWKIDCKVHLEWFCGINVSWKNYVLLRKSVNRIFSPHVWFFVIVLSMFSTFFSAATLIEGGGKATRSFFYLCFTLLCFSVARCVRTCFLSFVIISWVREEFHLKCFFWSALIIQFLNCEQEPTAVLNKVERSMNGEFLTPECIYEKELNY